MPSKSFAFKLLDVDSEPPCHPASKNRKTLDFPSTSLSRLYPFQRLSMLILSSIRSAQSIPLFPRSGPDPPCVLTHAHETFTLAKVGSNLYHVISPGARVLARECLEVGDGLARHAVTTLLLCLYLEVFLSHDYCKYLTDCTAILRNRTNVKNVEFMGIICDSRIFLCARFRSVCKKDV